MKRNKFRLRAGFTLIEVLAVVAITGVLAAIAAPSLWGFLESGRQNNRQNIARTIYLGAQNQITELKITKNLKSFLSEPAVGEYYTLNPTTGQYDEESANLTSNFNVSAELGSLFPSTDAGEENYVHYLSKSKGVTALTDPVIQLLDPVILDKAILSDAILIEFNVRTGVVLSVFYSDAIADGQELEYLADPDDDDPRNVTGSRIYTSADNRRQGYYGVGDTVRPVDVSMPAIINVYDSISRPLPDDDDGNTGNYNLNVLYAEMIIPEKDLVNSFGLSIIAESPSGGMASTVVKTIPASTLSSLSSTGSLSAALADAFASGGDAIYRYDGTGSNDINDGVPTELRNARIIWVLDYVGGNMISSSYSISRYSSAFDGKTNIRAGLQGSVSAESVTAVNPYFFTENNAAYSGDRFTIKSARHLHNIRYLADGIFTQRDNIDLAKTGSEVSNFAPIPLLEGTYTGMGYSIKNLTINTSSSDTGLFGQVIGPAGLLGLFTRASVIGVTLEDPLVSGGDNTGALCGTLDGLITGVLVRYPNGSSRYVSGGENTGGIAGLNNTGILTDSTFVSPNDFIHISGGATTTGGMVGRNDANGRLQRMLFLAISPKDAVEDKLTPIMGLNSAPPTYTDKLCYLSGTAIWPTIASPSPYNTEAVKYSAGHEGLSTLDICNSGTFTSGGSNWLLAALLDDERIDPFVNNQYPYPYARYTSACLPGAAGQWPIAEGGSRILFNNIAYYERYSDGTYGLWTYGDAVNTLNDDLDINETGYLIMLDEALTGTHYFFARNADAVGDWTTTDRVTDLDTLSNVSPLANGVTASLGVPSGSLWVFGLPLNTLSYIENQSKPLHVMYTVNDATGGTPKAINGYIQPLFAKGLYSAPDPLEFYVRTPWHMKNISVLTGATDYTEGKTFTQERSLNFLHAGIGVHSPDGAGAPNLSAPVVDETFKGVYDAMNGGERKIINNVLLNLASTNNVGLFSNNGGTIRNITLESSDITGSVRVGGIAGTNSASSVIEGCLVTDTNISGSSYVGGIVGENLADISKSGVIANSYYISGSSFTVGGIAGANSASATVSDVFLLSTNEPDDSPVSNSGGGIVGNNGGVVESAIYLAPAPTRTSSIPGDAEITIYPIVRSGNDAAMLGDLDTCFYLSGHRYSLDEGRNWIEEPYNSTPEDTVMEFSGGGAGVISSFIDKEWLNYTYRYTLFDDDVWYQPYSNYPYPMLEGMDAPYSYPLTDSPTRPDQVDRSSWDETLPTSNRALNLGFLNGDFTTPYITGVDQNLQSVGNNGARRHYVDMRAVVGWNTRPVDGNTNVTNWRWIELQEPVNISSHEMYNDYMYTNYEGNAYTGSANVGNSTYRYAELNADVQGTLYQLCPTTPGAKFYYSFYHTSRLGGSTATVTDQMSFYLTGVSNDALYANDNALVLIRPCWSPRIRGTNMSSSNRNYNPAVRNTVAYGNGHTLSYYSDKFSDFPANARPYLYDVWISNLGYGITFWSNSNVGVGNSSNQIPTAGVANISNLPSSVRADAQNHVIGYWGDSFGWKHYYGLYTVPEGQNRTEFAYQSNTPNPTNGNYLDGISFKAPAFVSIDKYVKMNGADVKFIKPGDRMTVELNLKSWGEVSAEKIVIEDRLSPFNAYIDYVVNSGTVTKGATTINGATFSYTGGVLTVTLPSTGANAVKLAKDETLKVTFDIIARNTVSGSAGTPTLLYYFKNQAAVRYSESEFKAYTDEKKNASGPDPVQVFIDPISLSKTVQSVIRAPGVPDQLINGPFIVTLTVENTLSSDNSIKTQGLINDLVPKGFKISDTDNNLPPTASITSYSDGSSRITIREVNLNEQQDSLTYYYTLEYVGDGYGVAYTNTSADYKYLYTNSAESSSESISVLLEFPKPVVGMKIKTQPDTYAANGVAMHSIDMLANDSFKEKLADGNYDVTPEIILTDEFGTPANKDDSGAYQIIGANSKYTAIIPRGGNMIQFTPTAGSDGTYTIYYRINLVATKSGGTPESFLLSSDVTAVVVTVTGT